MFKQMKITCVNLHDQFVGLSLRSLICGLVCFVLFAGVLLFSPARLVAQINSGSLQGTITDPSGAAVDGAQISVELADTATARTTVSNGKGEYTLPSLAPGVYTITATKTGFTTYKQTKFNVEVGEVATLNLTLSVGSTSQVVEVSAEAQQIQTGDATLGGVIGQRTVQELPLNGRQFTQLLQLEPGTVPVDVSNNNGKQPGFGAGSPVPAINGGTNRSNLFYLDGIYATDPFFAGFSFNPSIDAISEFKEQTHTDQAEFGGATGAIVTTVTRSGTNSLHGSAFEFLRNTVLDAKNFFSPTRLPYIQNQFGGTLGGPIIKNKLFFFGYYEGGRQVQGLPAYYQVPTAAERGGDFTGNGPDGVTPLPLLYDPTTYNKSTYTEKTFLSEYGSNKIPTAMINTGMQAWLNAFFPAPNLATPVNGNNYYNSQGNRERQDQGSVRIDYNLSANDSLYGRYSQGASINTNGGTNGEGLGWPFTTGFNGFNTGGTWVHTFGPTLVTTLTVGVNKLTIPQTATGPPDQGALLSATGMGAGFNAFPGGTAGPQAPAPNSLAGYSGMWNGAGPIGPMTTGQISGDATKTIGAHEIKFGASWLKTYMYTNWNGNSIGFTNEGTWNAACQFAAQGIAPAEANCPGVTPANTSLADAGGDSVAGTLLSLPNSANRNLGNSGVSLRMTNFSPFVQDSWKISSKLTLNYGLRWDYNSPVTDTYNRLPTYDVYNQTYVVPKGDADLPSGPLPANVVESDRRSITATHFGDFSPRVGLAYRLGAKTVLRIGAGRSFDSYSETLQANQNNRGGWPSGLSQNANANNLVNTAGISLKPDGTPYTGQNPFFGTPVIPASPLPAGGGLGFLDVKWQPDSSWQWNFQVQRDLGQAGIVSLAYVGSNTIHTNLAFPYNTVTAPTTATCCVRPDLVFGAGGDTDLLSTGTSNYEALQANLKSSFNHGFAYTASFTWAKNSAIANCGDWAAACIQNAYNLKQEYGPSDLNVPLTFVVSALYELPFGKTKEYANSGIGAAILGGWQLGTIVSLRSGLPVNATLGGSSGSNAGTGGGTLRPNFVGNPYSGAPNTVGEWFNASAFAIPALGTFGDAGLNALRGPDFRDVDFSVIRTFGLTERFKLQFRAEMFDLFNHPNFANPNLAIGVGVTNFDTINNTVQGAGADRNIQFALKLLF
jgi:Carboxypeptidase regulatory-like domain